jgi:Protein of unknown function (DUF3040)
MLSERERQTLASMERQLMASDPDLARQFARGRPRKSSFSMPTFLLVTGLLLMVLGSLIVTASVAITGIAFALVALCLAHFRSSTGGWRSPA